MTTQQLAQLGDDLTEVASAAITRVDHFIAKVTLYMQTLYKCTSRTRHEKVDNGTRALNRPRASYGRYREASHIAPGTRTLPALGVALARPGAATYNGRNLSIPGSVNPGNETEQSKHWEFGGLGVTGWTTSPKRMSLAGQACRTGNGSNHQQRFARSPGPRSRA